MGGADEFDVLPDIDKGIPAANLDAWSLAPSATAQASADLQNQLELRKIAEQKTLEIMARCRKLEKKLARQSRINKQNKAQRDNAPASPPRAQPAAVRNDPRPSRQPFVDVTASQHIDDSASDESDDRVPSPQRHGKLPTFEDLNSVLCEYKVGRLTPTFDGDISFEVCAELAEEEVEAMSRWNIHERKLRNPMIMSALRLIYADKPNSWFDAWWTRGPDEVTDFWSQIVQKRANTWRRRHKKAKRKADQMSAAEPKYAAMRPVAQRLQQKLKKKKSKPATKKQRSGMKSKPIVVHDSDTSDSDKSSGDDEPRGSAAANEHVEKEERLAPGPETYTKGEIKTYDKMARAIEEVDETRGHSSAVADFIDTEFSDNSGIMVKARRAPKGSWRKARFTRACEKAGKIMEERSVGMRMLFA